MEGYCYDEHFDDLSNKLETISDKLSEIIYLLKGCQNNSLSFNEIRESDYIEYRGVKVDKMALKHNKDFVDEYIDSMEGKK